MEIRARLLGGKGEQKRRAVKLAALDEIRAAGPVAKAFWLRDREVRRLAENALIRLLPRLLEADRDALTHRWIRCLLRALKGPNVELSVAILGALAQLANEDAMIAVS